MQKNRLHFNGIRICFRTVVTAQQNGELLDFLNNYKQSCAKRGTNLSLSVRTDMPKTPGRKGDVPSTARRSSPKLAINKRVKRKSLPFKTNEFPNQMCSRMQLQLQTHHLISLWPERSGGPKRPSNRTVMHTRSGIGCTLSSSGCVHSSS